jgi:excisionase family DNA binding protein
VLLAVPEPAQPARLGVAIKQPPPVRFSTTLGYRRVSVAVRHSILPAADGRRRPPAWRLGASGGRRIRATAADGWGVDAPGARHPFYPSLPYPVKTLSYPDIATRQVTPAPAGWQNPAASRLGSRDVPELLTQQQLADELQVSVRTLERWRREGTGPSWVRVGRSPRYRRQDIDRWLEATRREPPQRE